MFVVSEAEAAPIRTAFEQRGEFADAAAMRRLFPGMTGTTQTRECARTTTAWQPLPQRPVWRSRLLGHPQLAVSCSCV
jgi:hypothetical protein